jgi:hypothetical protein
MAKKMKAEKKTKSEFAFEKYNKVWVMVDTISTFRMRYVVEAPADHPEYALDTVTMDEANEFSQEHLGETIVSHRVVSEKEALAQVVIDQPYLSEWSEDLKKEKLFTFVEDGKVTNGQER